MAVARPQSGSVLTGVHIALIAFVVVTVVALVFLVLMYTKQEELVQRAEGAEKNAASAVDKEQALRDQLGTLANLVSGNRQADAAKLESDIKQTRDAVAKQAGIPNPNAALLDVLKQLGQQCAAKSTEAATCQEQLKQRSTQYEEMAKQLQERETEFKNKAEEFKNQYEEQAKATEANLRQRIKPVELLVAKVLKKEVAAVQIEQDVQKAQDEVGRLQESDQRLKETQDALAKSQKEAAEKQQTIDGLNARYARYRQTGDPRAVLQQADGRIVRVLSDQAVAYIDLGRRDRVTPGLTFAVYSPFRGISREGRGKATIEVTEVFVDTSQCRITSVEERGGVVVAGDLVANPVYERGRVFNFAVAGDFDLDFDRAGHIDDPDGVKVKKLIQQWGGRVVDDVDETTDFIVLGRIPPAIPPTTRPADTKLTEEQIRLQAEENKIRAAEQARKIEAFNRVKAAAHALSLPIMTRLEFLQFIGFRVPPAAITFAVAGDFDLNLDGVIDDYGGRRIRGMIHKWGGHVGEKVDEKTDFVVLGAIPERAADAERYNDFKAAAEKYLVPTMTPAQILDFIDRVAPGVAEGIMAGAR